VEGTAAGRAGFGAATAVSLLTCSADGRGSALAPSS
jgi:hypothetical protein